jgi:hypothetical protein
VLVNFPWNWQRMKTVRYNLELAGWYQTVPYLWLRSQLKRHIATTSYLTAFWVSFGNFKTCKQGIAECMT